MHIWKKKCLLREKGWGRGEVPKLMSKSYHKLTNWVSLCAIYKLSFVFTRVIKKQNTTYNDYFFYICWLVCAVYIIYIMCSKSSLQKIGYNVFQVHVTRQLSWPDLACDYDPWLGSGSELLEIKLWFSTTCVLFII